MKLAMLLKEAATTSSAVKVKASTPVIAAKPMKAPAAPDIKAPKISAGTAPKIPATTIPRVSMPAITSGLNIQLPTANEILSESMGVNTKQAQMEKRAGAPLLLALPALFAAGAPLAGRLAYRMGGMKNLAELARGGSGLKSLFAKYMVGPQASTGAARRLGDWAARTGTNLSGLNEAQLAMLAEEQGSLDLARHISRLNATGNPNYIANQIRNSAAKRISNEALRQQVPHAVANQMALAQTGSPLAQSIQDASQALAKAEGAQAATTQGNPNWWKWMLGGAAGMGLMNGGLGNVLGFNNQRQQGQRAPMMTMPMMYM